MWYGYFLLWNLQNCEHQKLMNEQSGMKKTKPHAAMVIPGFVTWLYFLEPISWKFW